MSEEQQEIQFATFRLGESLFCMDIMRISELLPWQMPEALPAPARNICGVLNLRGRLIPVMNLKKRLGMPDRGDEKSGNLIVVRLDKRRLLALEVDEMREVVRVPLERIMPVPEMDDVAPDESILGVCLSADNFYVILGIDALMTPLEA